MAKPILYYVLARGSYGRRGFTALGVTSEKGGQVYGRDENDYATHISVRDVVHRFPEGTSLDFARDATKRADEEYRRHEVGIRMAREELSRLEDLRQQRTLDAAKGVVATHPKPDPHATDGVTRCPECGAVEGSRKTRTGCDCIPL